LDTCSLQSAQEVRWKISDTLLSPIWSRSERISGWKFHTHWFGQRKTIYTLESWQIVPIVFANA
jgi:neutral trehalase